MIGREIHVIRRRRNRNRSRSSEARRKLREQMQAEIDAFLRAGGRIQQLEPTVSAQAAPLTATAGNELA